VKILLVRLRQIGDVVFTTPAVRALRRRFPGSHIAYVVEPAAAPVVESNPHIDNVIVVPAATGARQLASDLAIGLQLRRARYDLAIDFHGGPRGSLLTWLSRAPIRIGYHVAGRSWMYSRRVARPRELRPRHSVENQWDLLSGLDIPPPDRTNFPVEMPIDQASMTAVAERLSHAGVTAAASVIVVHVSAGNSFRQWPIESFAALVETLASSQADRRVFVTSGPSDREAAAGVIADARAALGRSGEERVLNCGEFSLSELRALLDRASLFIGGDSGPLHIAATSAVPIVALYGPTLPARSGPWRAPHHATEAVEVDGLPCRPCDQRVCAPGDFRCLTRVGPQQVLDAAERTLARSQRVVGDKMMGS
jgi:lipopolysaccharide heptosyltransferase II